MPVNLLLARQSTKFSGDADGQATHPIPTPHDFQLRTSCKSNDKCSRTRLLLNHPSSRALVYVASSIENTPSFQTPGPRSLFFGAGGELLASRPCASHFRSQIASYSIPVQEKLRFAQIRAELVCDGGCVWVTSHLTQTSLLGRMAQVSRRFRTAKIVIQCRTSLISTI